MSLLSCCFRRCRYAVVHMQRSMCGEKKSTGELKLNFWFIPMCHSMILLSVCVCMFLFLQVPFDLLCEPR